MQSLKELFKIGNGPSSSHTMGPKRAVEIFKNKNLEATKFKIILYGSLALTGKGHLTDYIIEKTLEGYETEIEFDTKTECTVHPNTFDIFAYKNEELLNHWRVYSVGGGTFKIEGKKDIDHPEVYKEKCFGEIKKVCEEKNIDLYEYVKSVEGEEIDEYLLEIWTSMQNTIEEGLSKEGMIHGKLNLERRAKAILEKEIPDEEFDLRRARLLSAYAYATNEENATGGIMVTAPTCGASGVLPAVLYYMKKECNVEDGLIIKALAVAGIIGNVVKRNASISGAECGCQAEVGTACSMAAAACAYIKGLSIEKIENAAEIAMEHHLGLTCDPIYGYVQIPCIERNAVAAMRAVDSVKLAMLTSRHRKISFDVVVETMYETGKDLQSHYRETSEGGLAKKYCRNKYYNIDMKEV